jgi:predicted MFS family arabinose efflux permease
MVSGSGFGLILTGWIIPTIITAYGKEAGWRYCWGALGLLIFLFWLCSLFWLREPPQEKASAAPPVPSWSRVYKSPTLWRLAFIYFTSGFSLSMYLTFFGAHTARAGGLAPAAIGHIWSLLGFLSIFSGLIWGWVSDRWGRRNGLLAVFALHIISLSIFAMAQQAWAFYLSASILGIAAWAIASILSATAADYVGPQMAAAAIGFITLVFGIGQVISPFVAGQIADHTGSFSLAYAFAATVASIGWLGCLRLRSKSA